MELEPCGDIFCHRCIAEARSRHLAHPMLMESFQCPLCSTVVQLEKPPNRVLINAVMDIEVSCIYCNWRGHREASNRHSCSSVKGSDGKERQLPSLSSSGTAAGPARWLPAISGNGTSKTSLTTATTASSLPPGGAKAFPLPPPRRAVNDTESALLRNFQSIEDDEEPVIALAPPPPPAAMTASLSPSSSSSPPQQQQSASSPVGLALSSPRSARSVPQSSSSRDDKPWSQYHLSQMEYDQMTGIFLTFDEQGTGSLTREQLRGLCFCMNFVQTEEDVDVLFCEMDVGGVGAVSLHNFLMWLRAHRPDPQALFGLTPFQYNDALLQFRTVDPQFHGIIDWRAFHELMRKNGQATTTERAYQLFCSCDERRCGYVSLQQFLKLMSVLNNGKPTTTTTAAPASCNEYGRPVAVAGGGGNASPPSRSPQPPPTPNSKSFHGRSSLNASLNSPSPNMASGVEQPTTSSPNERVPNTYAGGRANFVARAQGARAMAESAVASTQAEVRRMRRSEDECRVM